MAVSGQGTYVAIGTASSETNVSARLTSADFQRMVDELESTTFGDGNHEFIPGLKGSSFDFEYDWDSTIDGVLAGLYGVAGKSMVVGPEGNTNGMVSYQVGGFVSKYGASSKVDGKVVGKGTFRTSGAVTRGTFS